MGKSKTLRIENAMNRAQESGHRNRNNFEQYLNSKLSNRDRAVLGMPTIELRAHRKRPVGSSTGKDTRPRHNRAGRPAHS